MLHSKVNLIQTTMQCCHILHSKGQSDTDYNAMMSYPTQQRSIRYRLQCNVVICYTTRCTTLDGCCCHFVSYFVIIIFCIIVAIFYFVVAMSDLVHGVEAMYHLP